MAARAVWKRSIAFEVVETIVQAFSAAQKYTIFAVDERWDSGE